MKLTNQKQAGFTLIELIIVIVILGILAVTAAPKFLNLQGDANASTLKGVDGAINSAMNIVYGKAVIKGIDKDDAGAEIGIDGNGDGNVNIFTAYGYPLASEGTLEAALDLDLNQSTGAGDFDFDASTSGSIVIFPYGADKTKCSVTYTQAITATPEASTVIKVDC